MNAHSIAEAEAADLLRKARVPSFEMNVEVLDASGRIVAVVDILFRTLRAVIEIDSREFHFSEDDWKQTLARHRRLVRAGLALEHDTPSEVRAAGSDWAFGVAAWLRARADELAVPYLAGAGAVVPGPDGPPPLQLPLIKRPVPSP